MKTLTIKSNEVQKKWYLVDAEGKTLGRIATVIARHLQGKHRAEYTPNMDNGDYIIVINADKVQVTGNKVEDKIYKKHTGYPGGVKSINFEKLQQRHPEQILELAIKGMMPKGPLGRQMLKKLKIYAGSEHPHMAQAPEILNIVD